MRAKSEMYRHQQAGVTELYERAGVQGVVPMGGGKTATALTAIRELIDDGEIRCALGLAPKRVAQLVWPREPQEWEHLKDMRVSVVAGSEKQRRAALFDVEADVYIVGVDNTQWLVDVLTTLPRDHKLFDLLFIDELSRFKNPRGKRYKALRKLQIRYPEIWPTIWGLTGTPRPNGYEDQFAPLTVLSRGKLWGKSFDKWRDQRFVSDFMGYNWTLMDHAEPAIVRDIASMSFTVSTEDMPDVPELQTVVHWVDLPPKVRAVYKDMERKLLAPFKNGEKLTLAASQAVASGKLSQIAQGFMYTQDDEHAVEHLHTEKADQLVGLIEGLDENVLIAYGFKEDLRVLNELYPGIPYLGAGVSDRMADTHERRWNAREYPRLALHPASAGHGLNLQRGGHQMVQYCLTWSAELYDQIIKRMHRPGQRERCFNHLILARDTVDEIKYERVVRKIDEQEAFRNYLKRI